MYSVIIFAVAAVFLDLYLMRRRNRMQNED
jgi:hypothetical protein